MKVVEITESEFKSFMKNYSGMYHFIHDELYYDYIKNELQTFLLGLKKDDALIGVCMISTYPMLKIYRGFTTHFGPLLESFNYQDFEFFIQEIDKFARKHKGLQINYAPTILYQVRDKEGNVIPNHREAHPEIIDLFKRNGFTHTGFTKRLIHDEHLRFQSVVDISGSLDDILKNMSTRTRYNTRLAERLPLKMRILDESEYDTFIDIYKETEERLGFDKVPRDRILTQLQTLKDKQYVTLSEIHLKTLEEELEEEIRDLQNRIQELEDKFAQNKATKRDKGRLNETKELLKNREKSLERTKEDRETYGDVANVSVGLYYINNNEMVYLYSGSNEDLAHYMGPNFLTYEMIKIAKEHGVDRFNMYGITGNFDEDAPDYGIFKFKQGYDARIEELPGTFIKIYKPLVYKIGRLLNKV